MTGKRAASREEYIDGLAPERKEIILELERTFRKHLPKGFESAFLSGMIHFVVPLSLYPAGYRPTPGLPLPFVAIASQKHFIAVYHMGMYAVPGIAEWLRESLAKAGLKPDMGKSCIRLNPAKPVPYAVFAELAEKITPAECVAIYEKSLNAG